MYVEMDQLTEQDKFSVWIMADELVYMEKADHKWWPNFVQNWVIDYARSHPELYKTNEEDPDYQFWRLLNNEIGGYGFHYYQNHSKLGNTVYEKLVYKKTEGIEFISQIDPIGDNVFKIDPGSDYAVTFKDIGKKLQTSYSFGTKFIYLKKHLINKAINEGKREEVKVNKVAYPEIVSYSGFFGSQYALVYVNNHESLTLRVFIKFEEMNNLRLSTKDEKNGCWYFILKPGQTVIKRLHPINPFGLVKFKGMSKKLFIVDPK